MHDASDDEPGPVVRVFVTYQQPDQEYPWQRDRTDHSSGSGVIVGPGLVLTGAHVIAHATFIQIRKTSYPDKFTARIKGVCHDADLALLEVEDPAFMDGVEPAEIGELPGFQDRVAVVGFPIGGEEISITEGVVSRIEVQDYTHSQRALLAVTVDAAINSGNSGGPVLDEDGLVVGIAFQSYDDAENIGELVPAPLVERFLRAIREDRPLGVPGLGFAWDNLENPYVRAALQLPDDLSGVRVAVLEHGGSADGVLRVDDALLAIDGLDIANNGTVRYQARFRTAFEAVLGTRFIGDEIPVSVWRDGARHELSMRLEPYRTLVPDPQFDAPRWFVAAGLVFQVLRRDYLAIWDRWWEQAPKPLVTLYRTGVRTAERQEILILTSVLADELNVGFQPHVYDHVETINGHRPRDLDDFVARIDAATDAPIDIRMARGGRIVLDPARRADWPRILERYSLPGDRPAEGTSPRDAVS